MQAKQPQASWFHEQQKQYVASSIFTPYAYLVLAQNIAKNIDQNLEHVEHM